MRISILAISAIGLIFWTCGSAFGGEFYVNAGTGSDANDGLSPATAWHTISHAISSAICSEADPAEIHVAAGTYSGAANGETFPLSVGSYVSLIGDGMESTFIDASGSSSRVIHLDMATDLVIDGFTITGGDVGGSGSDSTGGGILCDKGSMPTIRNCRITGNKAVQGGGIYMFVSAPYIVDCEIVGNTVKGTLLSGGKSLGGGIFSSTSFPRIERCSIADNSAEPGLGLNAGGSGGGIYLVYLELTAREHFQEVLMTSLADPAVPEIIDCEIVRNSCTGSVTTGGGISCLNISPMIVGCGIAENSVTKGGGGIAWVNADIKRRARSSGRKLDGAIESCRILNNTANFGAGIAVGDASPSIFNCLIVGNSADGNGGAFEFEAPNGICAPAISNCTISNNSAGSNSGSVANWWGAAPTFENSILWGNGSEHILIENGSVGLDYCCVEGGWVGGTNIANDPLFAAGPMSDYYLSCQEAGQVGDSPCIDSGSDTAISLELDRLTTRTDYVFDSGTVDLGYHHPLPSAKSPEIECVLNKSSFLPGDELIGHASLSNAGPGIAVDIYIGFFLPDGTVISLPALYPGVFPYLAGYFVEQGTSIGPVKVVLLDVPSGPDGDYFFVGAIMQAGQFALVGELSLFQFSIQTDI
ncbi:MAG: right-handed parallel beta-helix repeat-containing protein [Candidatus Coatesbacteria bacterium]|nr:right-handed parallel beta-helix repeat-containing protein [Candidatus Coatesbacteria bacterium]